MTNNDRNVHRTRMARAEMLAIYALCALLLAIMGASWMRGRGYFRSGPVVEHTPSKRPVQPIDLNSADAWELDLLPGIGEARAQEIIALREKKKGFKSVDELTEIRGITPRAVDEMREFVRVGRYPPTEGPR